MRLFLLWIDGYSIGVFFHVSMGRLLFDYLNFIYLAAHIRFVSFLIEFGKYVSIPTAYQSVNS